MFQGLQAEHACTLAHDEAITILVPWPAGTLRVVVSRGQRLASDESGNACPSDWSLRAAREHQIALPSLDVFGSSLDAVVSSCACRDNSIIWALEAQINGEKSSRHIDQ